MKKSLIYSVVLFCLGLGLTITSMAQTPVKVLDTPEVKAELEKARRLAGDDKYLLITERLQCHEIGPDGEPVSVNNTVERSYPDVNVEPTRVFDNVYYVGDTGTGGWIITTSDGYILLDSMYGDSPEKSIIPGMKKLGLDPAKIKYILITHTGPDHVGGAKYFQDKYGTRVLMDAKEWDRVQGLAAHLQKNPLKGHPFYGTPKRDLVGTDGQKLTVGDTTITMVVTPRQGDGGGLSYIIPVFDNGEPHMWATYGNTGASGLLEDKMLYRESVKHFLPYMDAAKVDVVMSSHPFVDGSAKRMKELRNRKPGEANPFVIGQDAARRYISILDQCAAVWLARNKAGLDDTGTMRLTDMPKGPRP